MFKRKKIYSSADELVDVVIDNTVTTGIGYAMNFRTGVAVATTATTAIGGIVVDILDKKGNGVFGSTLRETGAASITVDAPNSGVIVTGGSNTTVDLLVARLNTSKKVIYSADVTGTINTTGTSSTLGGWFMVASALAVDETTHTRTIATGGQLKGWGADPENITRVLVSINASEVWDSAHALV